MNELFITGIPRSGTTLTTAIVDGLEDTLALSEPAKHTELISATHSADEYVRCICQSLKEIRSQYFQGLPIYDKRTETGAPITNYFERPSRKDSQIFTETEIRKPGLSREFLLASKHNAHYTSVLPNILKLTDIPIIAIVRHPISTLLSWRSLKLPISRGRLPAGERYWLELSNWISEGHDLLTTQVGIYELFCERYLQFSDKIKIIRYEDIVADEGLLPRILGRSLTLRVNIEQTNKNNLYPIHEVTKIRNTLDKLAPSALKLYPDLDVFFRDL